MSEQFSLYYWCSVPLNDTCPRCFLSHIVTNSPVFATSPRPDGVALIGPICLKAQTAIVSPHLIPLWVFSKLRAEAGSDLGSEQQIRGQYPGRCDQSEGCNWICVRSPDHRMLFSPDSDGPSLRLTMNPLILNTSTSDVKQIITWVLPSNKLSS